MTTEPTKEIVTMACGATFTLKAGEVEKAGWKPNTRLITWTTLPKGSAGPLLAGKRAPCLFGCPVTKKASGYRSELAWAGDEGGDPQYRVVTCKIASIEGDTRSPAIQTLAWNEFRGASPDASTSQRHLSFMIPHSSNSPSC